MRRWQPLDWTGWERHGITHSSVSQINTWETAPSLWVAEKLFDLKRPASPAMWRGICVEDICTAVIGHGQDFKSALKNGLKKFDKQFIFDAENAAKERANIEPMAKRAIDELAPFGQPEFNESGKQKKVEITCNGDGWKLPIIGFIDYDFPKEGLIVDLKTTLRAPSEMTAAHKRQRAFYQKCSGNRVVKFLYITPKKAVWLEDGDVQDELTLIKAHLNRQEKFLSLGDKELLASIVPVDPNHFFWRGSSNERNAIFKI